MNNTLIVYGSSTGTCEDLANRLAKKLGVDSANVVDVANLSADQIAGAQNLILGTSTWGAGELQDDWYDGVKLLEAADLSGKTIALFGCGDSDSYSDTYCSAMGELYKVVNDKGANLVGQVSTEGYTYDDSEAVIDGQFVGLALDDVNEDNLTDERMDAWVSQIKSAL